MQVNPFLQEGQGTFFNRSNTDSLSFPSEGDFLSMLQALSFTADGIMSGRRLPSALFSAQSRHGDTVNFAGRAGLDACFDDIFSNDIPVDSQFLAMSTNKYPDLYRRIASLTSKVRFLAQAMRALSLCDLSLNPLLRSFFLTVSGHTLNFFAISLVDIPD